MRYLPVNSGGRMRKKILILCAALFAGGCKVPIFNKPAESPEIGRYEIKIHSSRIYVLDTVSGSFWEKSYGEKGWHFIPLDMRPPREIASKDAKKISENFEMNKNPGEFSASEEKVTKSKAEMEFEKRVKEILEQIKQYEMRKSASVSKEEKTKEDKKTQSPESGEGEPEKTVQEKQKGEEEKETAEEKIKKPQDKLLDRELTE